MTVGILLGPTGLGWIAPTIFHSLFPPGSVEQLNAVSQVGLVLFLFLVGLRLDLLRLREQGRSAVVISNASISIPFVLGVILAVFLYPRFSGAGVAVLPFTLFLGAAMSVTAFPVLARILHERGLERTRLGTVALVCAAVDDVTAWLILAGIVALVRSQQMNRPLYMLLLLAGYLAVMWFGVRRLARSWEHPSLTSLLLLALLSSIATDLIGLHALFGAFIGGLVLSDSRELTGAVAEKVEPITVEFLLPLFFAASGLRTQVGLLDGWAMWGPWFAISAVAVPGKWGGGMLAAGWMGMPWKEAAALGILMNTRGLIELVILNIGLDLGVLSSALFSMMVLMALVTTFMTSLLLSVLGIRAAPEQT
jgi:Kef-type K+ transport system membrane component KefB